MTPSSPLFLGVAPLLATNNHKSGGSSSGSSLTFLIIIVLFVAVYFFILRPRSQRAKTQAAKGKSFEIGDEVMSVGGIFGRVVGLADDSVDVEVADGIVLTFLRRAVNPRPPAAAGSAASRITPRASDDTDRTSFGASSGHFADSHGANGGPREGGDDLEAADYEDDSFDDDAFDDDSFDDDAYGDGDDPGGEGDQDEGEALDEPGRSAPGTPRTSRSEGD